MGRYKFRKTRPVQNTIGEARHLTKISFRHCAEAGRKLGTNLGLSKWLFTREILK